MRSAFTAAKPPSAATSAASSRPAVRVRDQAGNGTTAITLPPTLSAASSLPVPFASPAGSRMTAHRPPHPGQRWGYSSGVQQPWYMQVDAGGRIGTGDLLKQLVRLLSPVATDL